MNSEIPSNEELPQDTSAEPDMIEFGDLSPPVWWASFLGPWLIAVAILVGFYLVKGAALLQNLAIAITATFLILGRFVILFGDTEIQFVEGLSFEMSSISLFIMLTIMDFIVAFFVAFHMDILFRAPFFGPKLEGMVSDGRFILKRQPWIRSVAFTGLVLFVIFPSSTTGSIGGSIFGRLLGMRRARVVTAILVGSLLGNGIMLVLANVIKDYIDKDNIWLKLGGVLGMIAILFFVERYYRSLKAKYMKEEEEEQAAAAKEKSVDNSQAANASDSAAKSE